MIPPIAVHTYDILVLLAFASGWLGILPVADFGISWDQVPRGLLPILIFLFRSFDLTLATLRMLSVINGRPALAWFLGFFQAMIFVLVIVGLLGNLQDPINLIAYATGVSTGYVLAITIESRVAPGHSLLRIVSPNRGYAIVEALRELGRGVTEIPARGKDGTVSQIYCFVPRREVNATRDIILQVDPAVFLTVENVRQLRGGWRA